LKNSKLEKAGSKPLFKVSDWGTIKPPAHLASNGKVYYNKMYTDEINSSGSFSQVPFVLDSRFRH